MEAVEWKSPRAIEAELRGYRHERFEHYMTMVDNGQMEFLLACAALTEEMNYIALEEAT